MVSNIVNADIHTIINLGMFMGTGLGGGFSCKRVSVRGRDDFAIGVHCDAIGSDLKISHTGKAMGNSLLSFVECLDLATFATKLLQMLKVTLGHWCYLATAENANLKILWFLLAILTSNLCTCAFEVI